MPSASEDPVQPGHPRARARAVVVQVVDRLEVIAAGEGGQVDAAAARMGGRGRIEVASLGCAGMLGAVWNLFDGWDATDTSLAISAGALGIAAWALGMSFSEHREFLARLRARADFTGTVKFPPADDTDGEIVTFVTEGNGGTIRIEVGLKNEGDRARASRCST
jgi:hypothetical protein